MEAEQLAMPDLGSALDDDIGDELLRLIFTACHPRLPREARAALALRMICGLTTEEISRAFLLPNQESLSASCAQNELFRDPDDLRNAMRRGGLGQALLGPGGRLPHFQ